MEHSPFEDSAPEETPAPPTEAKGELVPPSRKPPTAVGAGDAQPPRRSGGEPGEILERLPSVRQVIEWGLDVLDAAGDALASRLGLR